MALPSGAGQKRLELPTGLDTGIWWYARFPNHYGGESAGATAARLQREFFEASKNPNATRQ